MSDDEIDMERIAHDGDDHWAGTGRPTAAQQSLAADAGEKQLVYHLANLAPGHTAYAITTGTKFLAYVQSSGQAKDLCDFVNAALAAAKPSAAHAEKLEEVANKTAKKVENQLFWLQTAPVTKRCMFLSNELPRIILTALKQAAVSADSTASEED